MAVFNDFKLSFPSDEQDFVQELINQCQDNESVKTFHHFAVLTSSEIADIIGDLHDELFLTELSEYIFNKAASVTSGTEEEKWTAYKNLFPEDYRSAIQYLIDALRESPYSLTYDDYKLESAGLLVSLLDSKTPSWGFNVDFSEALRERASRMFDGWQALHNLYAGEEQKAIAELLEHFQVTLNIPKFEDFVALGATGIADEIRESYADTLYVQNIAKTFRDKAVEFINGYTPADVLEDTFINSYREEMREGVKQFIQTLKDDGVIISLSDIKNISLTPGTLTLPGSQPANPQTVTPQTPTIGMAFVLEINDKDVVYYKATAATVANVTAGLTSVINGITSGEWEPYTATDNTTDLSISGSGDFTLSNLTNNYFPYLQAIIANLGDTHPLYFSLAQALYNDALPLVGSGVQNYTLKGRLYKLDDKANEIPLAGYKVEAFDLPSEDSIGTAFSNDDGYFSIAYSLPNVATTSKTFRFKVYDEDDSLLNIAPQVKTNLFADADGGSFENGTAPDFTEWNLVKGTDIKINSSERLSGNLQSNGDFSSTTGWYENPGETDQVDDGRISGGGYAIGGYQLWTSNVLTIGKKYKVTYDLNIGGGGSVDFYGDENETIIHTSNSTATHSFDFVAQREYIGFEGTNGIQVDNFSVQEYVQEDTAVFEGEFSPEFYLDADVPTADLVFNGDAAITVAEDTDYEISAYVYFASAIVQLAGLTDSGIYLKPTSFTFNDLKQSEVANGANLLKFGSSSLYKGAASSGTGIWTRISARFNSGANTSLKIGVYLKGTLSNFSPRFGFYIDKIQLTEVPQESVDIAVVPGSVETKGILVEGLLPSSLSAALKQAHGASQPQKSVIIPENVHKGDTFVATLNNTSPVSYKADSSSEEAVVDGLISEIIKETADVTITEDQAASSSQPQITHITPQDVLVGAKFVLTKTMKNIFTDGDNGTFEDDSNGITEGGPYVTNLTNLNDPPKASRGTKILYGAIDPSPVGKTLFFSTETLIKVKRNTRYKISAFVEDSWAVAMSNYQDKAEFYFLPKGYAKSDVEILTPKKVSATVSGRKEVFTVFNSFNNDTVQIEFYIDLAEQISSGGGGFYMDELRLEEYPEKTPTIEYTAQAATVADVVTGLTAALPNPNGIHIFLSQYWEKRFATNIERVLHLKIKVAPLLSGSLWLRTHGKGK